MGSSSSGTALASPPELQRAAHCGRHRSVRNGAGGVAIHTRRRCDHTREDEDEVEDEADGREPIADDGNEDDEGESAAHVAQT